MKNFDEIYLKAVFYSTALELYELSSELSDLDFDDDNKEPVYMKLIDTAQSLNKILKGIYELLQGQGYQIGWEDDCNDKDTQSF